MRCSIEAVDDLVLAREVVIQRGLGDAEPLRDLPQRGVVVALLGEELEGDGLDVPADVVGRGSARLRLGPAITAPLVLLHRDHPVAHIT